MRFCCVAPFLAFVGTGVPLVLIGAVLGWTAVLLCRCGVRPLKALCVAVVGLISSLIMSACFDAAWWPAPSGLVLGALLHGIFLSTLRSDTFES